MACLAFACLASLLPFAFQVSINVFDKCADFSPYTRRLSPAHSPPSPRQPPLRFISHQVMVLPPPSPSFPYSSLASKGSTFSSALLVFPVCLSHYLVMLAISAAHRPPSSPIPLSLFAFAIHLAATSAGSCCSANSSSSSSISLSPPPFAHTSPGGCAAALMNNTRDELTEQMSSRRIPEKLCPMKYLNRIRGHEHRVAFECTCR